MLTLEAAAIWPPFLFADCRGSWSPRSLPPWSARCHSRPPSLPTRSTIRPA